MSTSVPIRKLLLPSSGQLRQAVIIGSIQVGEPALYAYRLTPDDYSLAGPLLMVGAADMDIEGGFAVLGRPSVAADDDTNPVRIPDHGLAPSMPPSVIATLFEEWPTISFLGYDYMLEADGVIRSPKTADPVEGFDHPAEAE